MNTKYHHLFFDLDHTLWDFNANSRLTLLDLYAKHDLEQILKASFDNFYNTYITVNDSKWVLYRQGGIGKEQLRNERFPDTFSTFGFQHQEFSENFEQEYLSICPYKTQLLPGTEELLAYLQNRYELHIITNGFVETQKVKIKESGLKPYFGSMISSEEIGINKPAPKIFMESMHRVGAKSESSLMIGDNLQADIVGAQNCGLDQVFYNPQKVKHIEKPTFEVFHLLEMKNFL